MQGNGALLNQAGIHTAGQVLMQPMIMPGVTDSPLNSTRLSVVPRNQIGDALLVAQYYVGLNPASFDQSKADTNCDGSVDIVDALLIAQYYVGLIIEFC